jgi:predicted nuclease of predicted toxin-antitoxin system
MKKFKIDENLPVEIAQLLRTAGYDAMTVKEQQLSGAPDSEIASICQQEKRILVTLDTDFADICTYPPNQFDGLIVLRLKRQDKPYIMKVFTRLMRLFPEFYNVLFICPKQASGRVASVGWVVRRCGCKFDGSIVAQYYDKILKATTYLTPKGQGDNSMLVKAHTESKVVNSR